MKSLKQNVQKIVAQLQSKNPFDVLLTGNLIMYALLQWFQLSAIGGLFKVMLYNELSPRIERNIKIPEFKRELKK